MDRWRGIFKVPFYPHASTFCKIAASLHVSPVSGNLIVPSANAIFFNGDRIERTGNTVIDRLSNLQNIADVIVSKFGDSVNAWVIEASTFNGPFAVYNELLYSLNKLEEPKVYRRDGFPVSTSIVALLSNFLEQQAKDKSCKEPQQSAVPSSSSCRPETFVLGFSKGGTVLNQLVTGLGSSDAKSPKNPDPQEHDNLSKTRIIPNSKQDLLNSITQIHYVDVGLNSAGAYLTDYDVIRQVVNYVMSRNIVRFVLHGTPRQWCDKRWDLIRKENDKMVQLLEIGAQESDGRLEVLERFYFDVDAGEATVPEPVIANCPICLEEMQPEEFIAEWLDCGHRYHGECLGIWAEIRLNCPVCRAEDPEEV